MTVKTRTVTVSKLPKPMVQEDGKEFTHAIEDGRWVHPVTGFGMPPTWPVDHCWRITFDVNKEPNHPLSELPNPQIVEEYEGHWRTFILVQSRDAAVRVATMALGVVE